MIKIDSKTVVYVVCPAGLQTGGTELCHQLVDYLNSNGRDSYVVYISQDYKIVEDDVPIGFQKYNVKVTYKIENQENNVIVFPETALHLCKVFNCDKMNYVFWWMSLDNYFHFAGLADYVRFKSRTIRGVASKLKNIFTNRFKSLTFNEIRKLDSRSINVYQSSYVNHYLLNQGVFNQLPLSDYINLDFVNEKFDLDAKEDIILYNPTKGHEVTEKIMKKMQGYNFIPLKNLNRAQLLDLMNRAKLYIDFGNHPGKDRIPREAVMNGCCILVGKNGSAQYFQDVPVFDYYKADSQDIEDICGRVDFILKNYNKCIKDFNFIRDNISKEKEVFEQEIKKIFF